MGQPADLGLPGEVAIYILFVNDQAAVSHLYVVCC